MSEVKSDLGLGVGAGPAVDGASCTSGPDDSLSEGWRAARGALGRFEVSVLAIDQVRRDFRGSAIFYESRTDRFGDEKFSYSSSV